MSIVDTNKKQKHNVYIKKCIDIAASSVMLQHHGAVIGVPNNQPKSWGQKCVYRKKGNKWNKWNKDAHMYNTYNSCRGSRYQQCCTPISSERFNNASNTTIYA